MWIKDVEGVYRNLHYCTKMGIDIRSVQENHGEDGLPNGEFAADDLSPSVVVAHFAGEAGPVDLTPQTERLRAERALNLIMKEVGKGSSLIQVDPKTYVDHELPIRTKIVRPAGTQKSS